ncbi:hypothetical protein H4219_002440 [Mycoemilia scoparia]|uniref:Conserved oligomeric Golgi complex subunit 1 n=1 Tax=Mycoemilia scoparia TaxID=417184 RepID=A0A9W8A5K5_9FUNG|nr:hypothetical protein H4219_002440 [Mycoemilia scoparia]
MRDVVGSRYPDLVGAANSIILMESRANLIKDKISSLSSLLKSLPENDSDIPATNTQDASKQQTSPTDDQSCTYSLAAQIKVLVDAPEQMWKSIEKNLFLHSSLIYLATQRIYQDICECCPTYDGFGEDIFLRFPIIDRQMAIIAPMRSQILNESNKYLATAGKGSFQTYLNALCAQILLENYSLEQACSVFLDGRKSSILTTLCSLSIPEDPLGELDYCITAEQVISHVLRVMETLRASTMDASDMFLSLGATGSDETNPLPSRLLTTLAGLLTDVDVAAMLPERLFPKNSQGLTDSNGVDKSRHVRNRPPLQRRTTRRRNLSMAGALITSSSASSEAPNYYSTVPAFTQVLGKLASGDQIRISHCGLGDEKVNKRHSTILTSVVSMPTHLVAKYLPESIVNYQPNISEIFPPNLASYNDNPVGLFEVIQRIQEGCQEKLNLQIYGWYCDICETLSKNFEKLLVHTTISPVDAVNVRNSVIEWENTRLKSEPNESLNKSAILFSGNEAAPSIYSTLIKPILDKIMERLVSDAMSRCVLEVPKGILTALTNTDISECSTLQLNDSIVWNHNLVLNDMPVDSGFLEVPNLNSKETLSIRDFTADASSSTPKIQTTHHLSSTVEGILNSLRTIQFPLRLECRQMAHILIRDLLIFWKECASWANHPSADSETFVLHITDSFTKNLDVLTTWVDTQIKVIEGLAKQKIDKGISLKDTEYSLSYMEEQHILYTVSFCIALRNGITHIMKLESRQVLHPRWDVAKETIDGSISLLTKVETTCKSFWVECHSVQTAHDIASLFDTVYDFSEISNTDLCDSVIGFIDGYSDADANVNYNSILKGSIQRLITKAAAKDNDLTQDIEFRPNYKVASIVTNILEEIDSVFGHVLSSEVRSAFWSTFPNNFSPLLYQYLDSCTAENKAINWRQLVYDIKYIYFLSLVQQHETEQSDIFLSLLKDIKEKMLQKVDCDKNQKDGDSTTLETLDWVTCLDKEKLDKCF